MIDGLRAEVSALSHRLHEREGELSAQAARADAAVRHASDAEAQMAHNALRAGRLDAHFDGLVDTNRSRASLEP